MKKAIARVIGAFLAASLFFQTPTTSMIVTDNIKQVEAATTKGTIKSTVNLRKTASNSAKVLKVLSKGTSVTITSTSTVGWYKVKVGTITGYVGRTYVTLANSSNTTSTSSSSSSSTGSVIASYLNLRKSASNSAKILKVLTYGTKVTIQGTTGSWYKIKVGSTTGYVSKAYIKKTSSSSSSNQSSSTSSVVTSSSVGNTKVKGQQIVNYALKFVGNKYVYGGTSLTKGADCSGFTMSVYKQFGYNLPRTSAAQRTAGKKVASLAQAQAGDLICYSGHVAIYMGNNKIVHSANPKRGIVSGDKATSMTILSIRRIV